MPIYQRVVKDWDLNHKINHVKSKLDYIDEYERKKTSALLVCGTINGLIGFVLTFTIGIYRYLQDVATHKWPSGQGYFPQSFSEMIHDTERPEGKVFLGFGMVASVMILTSWYPWELSNVYIDDDFGLKTPFGCISWTMLRQMCPVPGMLVVLTCSSVPIAIASGLDNICTVFHTLGAMGLFVAYPYLEFKKAFTLPEQTDRQRQEKRVRLNTMRCSMAAFGIFITCEIFGGLPFVGQEGSFTCCLDKWHTGDGNVTVGGRTIKDPLKGQLMDAGTGFYLGLKVVTYTSEVFIVIFILLNLLAIWYYCEERHLDLNEAHAGRVESLDGA